MAMTIGMPLAITGWLCLSEGAAIDLLELGKEDKCIYAEAPVRLMPLSVRYFDPQSGLRVVTMGTIVPGEKVQNYWIVTNVKPVGSDL